MLAGYLLDTNAAAAFFVQERSLLQLLSEIELDLYIPSVVVGELYVWAFYPTIRRERLGEVRTLLSMVAVLGTDVTTGERYGLIYADLERRGVMIPINDIWIAALALQHNCAIVTRDTDFQRIPSLTVVSW